MKQIPLKKNCEICGKEFIVRPHKTNRFCGLDCYHKAQAKGLYKYQFDKIRKNRFVCDYCGKEVLACKSKKRNGELSEHIFCNRTCYDNYRRLNTDKTCKYCGKHFVAICAKKKSQFCDDNCRRAYFTQKALSYCLNCGQAFYPWTFDIKRNAIALDREVICCSEKCAKEYHARMEEVRRNKISIAFTGSKHPNWAGGRNQYRGENWSRQRYLARKRDNNICQICGISQKQAKRKYKSGLQVHHKIPYIFFSDDYIKANSLDNLILLCGACHQKEEWKYRKEHEDEYKKLKTS